MIKLQSEGEVIRSRTNKPSVKIEHPVFDVGTPVGIKGIEIWLFWTFITDKVSSNAKGVQLFDVAKFLIVYATHPLQINGLRDGWVKKWSITISPSSFSTSDVYNLSHPPSNTAQYMVSAVLKMILPVLEKG